MESTGASENAPLSNQKSTILGVTISFQIIAFLSVVLRLYVRLYLMKSPGWDDVLVVLALVSVTNGTVFVCLSTNWGLGQHFATLLPSEVEHYLFHFYVANASYNVSTVLIKLSLLFQYLRAFNDGLMRKLCIAMIVIISAWGIAYSFMAWFPCFPIRAYWDWSLIDANCYAYGTKEQAPFVTTYESHSALNMIFDIAVFFTPISLVWRKERSRREYIAILGLLAIGVLIVVISSWRLATIVEHQAGWEPALDFTYYAPISILLACLEVDIAILAASMPIFWPVILQVLQPILVTREIHVTSERRRESIELELESASIHSETELHRKPSYYKDAGTVERVTPLDDHPAQRVAEGYRLKKSRPARSRGAVGVC